MRIIIVAGTGGLVFVFLLFFIGTFVDAAAYELGFRSWGHMLDSIIWLLSRVIA